MPTSIQTTVRGSLSSMQSSPIARTANSKAAVTASNLPERGVEDMVVLLRVEAREDGAQDQPWPRRTRWPSSVTAAGNATRSRARYPHAHIKAKTQPA